MILREIRHTRQPADEPPKRWFHSPAADLYVWSFEKRIVGLQFCLGDDVITWRENEGYAASKIDSGRGWHAGMSPILVAGQCVDIASVMCGFEREGAELPLDIRVGVSRILARCPVDSRELLGNPWDEQGLSPEYSSGPEGEGS